MFAKSKCLLVLNRSCRYVQARSIRKCNQLKYSAASIEGSVSKLQVKRNQSSSHLAEESWEPEVEHLGDNFSTHKQFPDRIFSKKKAKLDELIKNAEELLSCRFHRTRSSAIGVGVSVSETQKQYFNLLPRWFQVESSMITSRIPSLLGSGHPLLRLKQTIFPNPDDKSSLLLSNTVQWRAFIILLVTKAFGHSKDSHGSRDFLANVEARQRTLSEISEMMHIAFSLHRAIVEIKHAKPSSSVMEEEESSLQLGNKIAILFGDLLLARTSRGLSALKNARVTELMSDAIGDFSESEILRRRYLEHFNVLSGSADTFKQFSELKDTSKNHETPSFESWRSRVVLDIGSLIGRSCLCSTIISQHDEGANKLAFSIGCHFGLLMQAYNDLELYLSTRNFGKPSLDLCTLPVIYHLNNVSNRIHKPMDVSEIYRDAVTSPVALQRTQNTIENLKEETLRLVSNLPRTTSAPQILEEFITTLS